MKNHDFENFKKICQMDDETLHHNLAAVLTKFYKKENIINTTDYIYAKGDLPVALVAHMDTVFSTPPRDIFYDKKQEVIWSPEGGIGDDRAGVFGILYILQHTDLKPSIIFTRDEETGGVGAQALVKDYRHPDEIDLKYIIELDRRGFNDCVFYNCANEPFMQYVESFGFKTALGSFTDISFICPTWEVAGVNISTGYFNEHAKSEYLRADVLLTNCQVIIQMLEDASFEETPYFIYVPGAENDYFNYAFDEAVCECKCGFIFTMSDIQEYYNEETDSLKCPVCKERIF